jgi:hypothetical protein
LPFEGALRWRPRTSPVRCRPRSCRSTVTVADIFGREAVRVDRPGGELAGNAKLSARRDLDPGAQSAGRGSRARTGTTARLPRPKAPARLEARARPGKSSSGNAADLSSLLSARSSSDDRPRFVSTVTRAASAETIGSALGSGTVLRDDPALRAFCPLRSSTKIIRDGRRSRSGGRQVEDAFWIRMSFKCTWMPPPDFGPVRRGRFRPVGKLRERSAAGARMRRTQLDPTSGCRRQSRPPRL